MLTAEKPLSRNIDHVERKNNTLVLESEYGSLFLEPKSDSIIRITFSVRKYTFR